MPSINNINIYQVGETNTTNPIMRQTVPANSFSIDPGQQTITLRVLSSTFNSPNSKYYVSTDSDFVKRKKDDEPITGLGPFVWNLRTGIYLFIIYLYVYQY